MKPLFELLDKLWRSTQARLTIIFLLALIPLVMAALYSNLKSRDNLKDQIELRTQNAMYAVLNYIDLSLDGAMELSIQLANNNAMNQKLQAAGESPNGQSLIDFQQIMDQLANLTALNPVVSQAAIYHHNSGILLTTTGYQRIKQVEYKRWLDQLDANLLSVGLYFPDEDRVLASGLRDPVYNTDRIWIIRQMDAYGPSDHNDIIIIALSRDYFATLINDILPNGEGSIHLYTDNNQLVASVGKSASQDADLADGTQFVLEQLSPESGWRIVLAQSEQVLFRETRQLQVLTSFLIALSLIIAVISAWIVYTFVARPLAQIIRGMQKVRLGQLQTRIEHRRTDEIGYVMDSFNEMVQQQRELIQGGYELQLRLARTELKRMQSQINPHFLYNALDSIYSEALLHGEQDIGEMVLHLSRFFRHNVGKGKEIITVNETFEQLQSYLKLQMIRFKDQLVVEIRIDEEVRSLPILKLLVQPLVENAIRHGFEQMGGLKVLNLRVHRDDGELWIRVMDNGRGIPRERLTFIQNKLIEIDPDNMELLVRETDTPDELFGLRNVKSRMVLHYGRGAQLSVDSVEGAGTTVIVVIPIDSVNQEAAYA